MRKYCMQWLSVSISEHAKFRVRNLEMMVVAGVMVLAAFLACPASAAEPQTSHVALMDIADRFGPDIFVPYQDLVQLIDPADKAILMDRAEFEKLLAAARANAEGADTLEMGQVTGAQYSAKVSGEELTLAGDLKVVSMSDGPVAVPLGFAQTGLTRVVLDGKPAPLGYDRQGKLTLIVSGKGSHRLEVAGTAKLKELSGGGMQFSISLPPAVAGRMKLSAPGDLEMHATVPLSQPVYDKESDRTSTELTVGGQDRLTVVLLGNGRREEDQAILLGESAATITLTRSHEVMSCLYTVQVLRRGVRQLQFQLPSQWTVTEITCPSLVRWSVDSPPGPLTPQTLTVRLRSAKVGTTALHIKAAAFRTGRAWKGPRITLVEAAFQRGYLMVNTDEELRVRAEKLTYARREDAARVSIPGIVGTSAGRLYFHWGDDWSVGLELATVALRRSIKEQQRLVVSPEEVTLTGDFEVTAIDRELFDISFVLPVQAGQWRIRAVRVNEQKTGFEYRMEDQPDRQLLTIELARPVLPEKVANVRIVLQHVPPDWHWPGDAAPRTITVPLLESQAQTVSGHISVSAVGDLDAVPTDVPGGLEVVPVGRMASLEISGKVQHAYSYKAATKGRVQLEVSRRRPRIAADVIGLVTARPQGLTADFRITYTISRASAKKLYLLADKSLEEKIKITAGPVDISSKNIVPAGETTMALTPQLTQRYNLWLLNLDQAGFGDVVVDVHYEHPVGEGASSVPLVRAICPGQINEQLAVQASEELALTIRASGAKEIDAIDLPPLPAAASRILAAYRFEAPTAPAGSNAEIVLETAVHENYSVPSALAVAGELTTYLDRQGGQRTEAAFLIANAGQQFLTFRLPEGAQLWSLRVANQQAKPQRSAQGDYQVPLARSREPIPVRIVYAYRPPETNLDRLQLGGVDIPNVEMNRIIWDVVPPPGYQITSQQTKMQTYNVLPPTPAYIQLYNFLSENLLGGMLSSVLPALNKASLSTFSRKAVYSLSVGKPGRAAMPPGEKAEEDGEAFRRQLEGVERPPTAPPEKAQIITAKRVADFVRLAGEGRFTLPVDLAPTPGAGPAAGFTGLGTTRLIVGLSRQYRQIGSWLVGFALIALVGMAAAFRRARTKAVLFVVVLSLASLLAIWWPATTYFANGAFMAGLCLLPLYLLIAFIRWLWPNLRLGPFATPQAAKAAGLILLVLVLASSAQAARAEQAARRPVPPQNDRTPLPPIIIPYEDDPTIAEKSQKVLIPYNRFVKLWNQAHPDDPIDGLRPGTDISLADVRYRVTTDTGQLKLSLTAQIRTYGKDWVVLPLPTRNLAVTEVTLDGKPAQWQGVPTSDTSRLRVKNSKTGTVLMLPSDVSGRLQLKAVTTPRYFGRRGSVSFSLPPLPAAVMTVILPEEDLELEVAQIEGTLSHRTVNGTVEWTVPLGMTRDITLRWLPKIGRGAADRTLSAVSEHDVYAFHWAIVGVTKVTYSFSAGEHDRFALCLPTGVTLTDLKGANIRDYRQVEEKTIEGATYKIIEVRLHRPAKKQYELTARWLADLPALDEPARLFLVRAGDVSRESGAVTLYGAGGMTVKVAEVTGGRRVSLETSRAESAAASARPVAKYYWPYRPFSLSILLSRIAVSPEASLDQLVRVSADRVQLLVQAALKAERGRLFGADFTLPEGYELLSVVGPVVENFYERSTADGGPLHVKFSSAEQATTMALVLVRSEVELENFQVPTIIAVDSEGRPLSEQQGRIAVQVAASLEAQTAASENLKSVAPRMLRDWLDRKQVRAVQFAYRYEVPNPSLSLNIRRQPTRTTVETFAGLVVGAAAADYTYRLRYNITGSPVDHLHFQMPSEYASLVVVESPAMRSVTQSDAGAGRTSWDVALVSEVTGTVDVTVNFTLPIDPATKLLQIPRIQTAAPQGYHGIVAVQNISRHKITLKDTTNLEGLPASEQKELIPAEMRQSLQYVFHSYEDNWSLSLDFTPAKPAARIQAVVDLLSLTTVIDRSGRCRYEARVALQNRSEQFLRVEMPDGLRLWSANVADQPVKPVVAANSPPGEVLIPLVKTSPGGLPYDVYLYFADEADRPLVTPLNGITKLKPPRISIVGIPVMQTTWSLRLPDGYRYMRPRGNMSPVAGTVEMLSLGIEAKLGQLKRLDKAVRGIAGTSSQREQIAQRNWQVFNRKLSTEIRQAQQYLEANRDEVAREDYERLRSKLSEQVGGQERIFTGNTAYVQRQRELGASNINVWLNVSAGGNAGVADEVSNRLLQEKPDFVAENERRQIARLNEELAASEQQLKDLQVQQEVFFEGKRDDDAVVVGGVETGVPVLESADKEAEMKEILGKLSAESAEQIDMKQMQLRRQLSEIEEGRAQRYFQKGAKKLRPPAMPPRAAEPTPSLDLADRAAGYAGRRKETARLRAGVPADSTPSDAYALEVAEGADVSAILPAGPPGAAEEPLAAGEVIQPYIAKGTYSLPVTLPEGQIRLDFAHPSGEAELSIWAVPVGVLRTLYGTLTVLGVLAVLLGVIKIWPESIERQPLSVKRVVVYIVLFGVLTVLLGLLGLLVGILIILAAEALRAISAKPTVSGAKS